MSSPNIRAMLLPKLHSRRCGHPTQLFWQPVVGGLSMRCNPVVASSVAAIAAVALAQAALAQNGPAAPAAAPPATTAPAPAVAEQADRLLKEMSAYIGSANEFTFHADVTFDHVMPSGQKLQFSAAEEVVMKRPGGLYVEWNGDLGAR